MSQHTPGPWTYDPYPMEGSSEGYAHEINRGNQEVAHTYMGVANARLIAAAPEMYDALRLLVRKAPRRRNAGADEFVGTEAVFDVAEKLLARIDGEEATS